MPFVTRRSLSTLTLLAIAAILAFGLFVWSGLYNIGADDTHTQPVHSLLQALRERSIEHHARNIEVPDLTDPALIRSGAGNYAAMCTGCHLAPGMADSELSKGLYPAPPNLSRQAVNDPAHDFWVVKHGIKASGMPAWGKSMEDRYIWGMIAFLQQLPTLDTAQYDVLVESSGGHAHGGGESGVDHHDAGRSDMPDRATEPSGTTHVHADGKTHVHAAENTHSKERG
jgi:mono/diheme cytochrome c family protein